MTIVQVKLTHSIDSTHRREKITWVDKHKDLKVGVGITLKNDTTMWTVAEIYPQEHDYNAFDWQRTWSNNI